ncbi:MAG TPA: FmdB family zinc ribbon protein [Jatrophihabitantaceae bacterium]|nr:FmdB family zinc ribbon protein [Jatrophihabitantaceae bacterium]
MPTYQYACTNPDCANRFELVQSFSDPAASECPVCGGAVRKVFSAVGVVFKGSGFYRTDSRQGSKSGSGSSSVKEPAAASSSTSADSGSSASSSSSSSTPTTGSAASSAAAS